MTRPPNILLISADQQRADCIGFMGRRVKTPHLDALAAAGTVFDAAITPSVVCQPARAAILTGRLPRSNGVHDNGIDLDPAEAERGFAATLARAGYQTAFFGKAHFSTYHTFTPTGTPECVTSSANFGPDWFGPYMGFQHVELMLVGHNWFPPEPPPRGQHYERWFHADGQGEARHALYLRDMGLPTDAAQCWHSGLPVAWHNSTWTADRALDWLAYGRDQDRPFCAWVSFPDPHHPFDCPEPWSRLHDPADVDLPPHRRRDLTGRPWWHEAVLTSEPAGDPAAAAIRKAYSRIAEQTDDQLRQIIANTYGQISLIDHQVGRLMTALQSLDLTRETVVIYFSDHGDWLGDHGLVLKGPMHFEGLLRVPLIMAGPGVPQATRVGQPVSTLDLAPTLAALSGAAPDPGWHGAPLTDLFRPGARRSHAFSEWDLLPGRTGVRLSLRTVRTQNAKLTIDLISGAGELYDLSADPHELRNLWDDEGSAALRRRLLDLAMARPDDLRAQSEPVGIA
jgi:arylsulfatase A-like enzyme